jgi:hypothetical protein
MDSRGFGGVSVSLMAMHWLTGSASGSKLSGWATFVTVAFTFCAWWLTFRWDGQILHLTTRLGRATLWFGGLSALLMALRWIPTSASGSK